MGMLDSVKSAFGGKRKEPVPPVNAPLFPAQLAPPLIMPPRRVVRRPMTEDHWKKMKEELEKRAREEAEKRSKYMGGG